MDLLDTPASDVAASTPPPTSAGVPSDDGGTLSDHESSYGKAARQEQQAAPEPQATDDAPDTETDGEPRERDEKGQFKPRRHRAKSQQASAGDVPRINELTRKLREAEAELQRYRAPQTTTTPQAAPSAPPQPARFSFPSYDTFVERNPNASWDEWNLAQMEAFSDWRDEQRGQKQRQQAAQTQEQTVEALRAERDAEWGRSMASFAEQRPDFGAKIQDTMERMGNAEMPPALREAVFGDLARGPEMLYSLVSNPSLLDEMHLLTDGKPVSDALVAVLRRRLQSQSVQRQSAAVTGSATAFTQPIIAPRPPNPVRTGPMKTGDEPPDDGSSLADHERAYGMRRRR